MKLGDRTGRGVADWDSRLLVDRQPEGAFVMHLPEARCRSADSPRPSFRPLLLGLFALLVLPLLVACSGQTTTEQRAPFRILSGSENQSLAPIVQRFADDAGTPITIEYAGSVDIMLALEQGAAEYDAVWPANSIWIALGDRQRLVTSEQSIMRSPVVLGVKRSVAERLGWIDTEVRVADLLAAAEAGDFRFMMTSASQSNSGASAYFGFLYAFAGSPPVLTADHLRDPAVGERVRRILGTVDRSSGSSGWLKDLFLERYDEFDAMVNYESLLIETNRELLETGREPLYAVYLVDGLAIADSPLGYVNHGDTAKEDLFGRLQQFLLAEEAQREIAGLGRRTGLVGIVPAAPDRGVFNPDWGIDLDRLLTPIRFPQADVVRQALDLYQTAFRKPSFTVFCLDFSGSMEGVGEADLTQAMATLLDQSLARTFFLQGSPDDITVVIPFNQAPIATWTVRGNDPAALDALLRQVTDLQAGGETNIYNPVAAGLAIMAKEGIADHSPAVILMTDGQSNQGSFTALQRQIAKLGLADIPIYAITFGEASEDQLKEITAASSGRIFDGNENLVDAFRDAKGYN